MAREFVGDLDARFDAKVDRSGGPEACWPWTASRKAKGYGVFQSKRFTGAHSKNAHRVAYERAFGPIPDGLLVCHSCDNPPCVNPAHLFLGTPADNAADSARKGRHWSATRRAEWAAKRSASKLAQEDALAIRVSTEPARVLAHRFGVDESTVRRVRRGDSWKSLSTGAAS